MPHSEQPPKITVEDLLRLKRSERPAPDFWTGFERELRQKQLSALVEKRAWWHDVPRIFSRRIYLPIGATAILAFTLVSLRSPGPRQTVQAEGGVAPSVPAANYSAENSPAEAPHATLVSSPLINRQDPTQVARINENAAAFAKMEVPAETLAQVAGLMDSPAKDSPSARSIAANLARLEQSEPELINSVLGSRLSSPARIQSSSAPVVELASLSLNGSRRSRLLAHYNDRQVSAEPATTDAVRERLSSRLGDGEFNDHFSRIGLNGNKVSLKF